MFKVVSFKLKDEFIKLLKEDIEFRYTVLGLLSLDEVIRRLDKVEEAIKSLQEQVLNLQKQVEEHTRAIKVLQEQVRSLQEQVLKHTKAIKSLQEQVAHHGKILEEHTKALRELTIRIDALGARWGILSEEAFRKGLEGVIKSLLGDVKIEKWKYYDEKGEVFGYPSIIDLDVVIKDDQHILIEIKSNISRGDVYEFYKIGKFYEKITGKKPRLIIISPYVDEKAKSLANITGIEIYSP